MKWLEFTGKVVIAFAIVIVGLLLLYHIGGFRLAGLSHVRRESPVTGRILVTKANLKVLHSTVKQFKMDTGRFPTEAAGLRELIERPSDVTTWEGGGYLEATELPIDAWGNDFIYELRPGSYQQFVIISAGPDEKKGTEDDLLSTDAY